MIYSKIIGTGSYLPKKILTNKDLEASLDTTDDWITSRTGIKERHIADSNENTSDLAFEASSHTSCKKTGPLGGARDHPGRRQHDNPSKINEVPSHRSRARIL